MASLIRRELVVSYGNLTIGGGTDRHIDGFYREEHRYTDFAVEFEFVTFASTELDFQTEISAIESAIVPDQRFLVQLEETAGSPTTILDANPATNSGFNTRAELTKLGDEHFDSGRSRRYRLRVTGQLPADLAGREGRRDSSVTVEYTPSRRRRVTIQGTWTAIGVNDATSQYAAQIETYVSTVLSGIDASATWSSDPEQERTTRDDQDKTITFVRVYNELLLAESTTATDDPAVVRQMLRISRSYLAPGDALLTAIGGASAAQGMSGPSRRNSMRSGFSQILFGTGDVRAQFALSTGAGRGGGAPGARPHRLIVISIQYEADLDASETTDPRSYWESRLRNHVIQQAITQANVGAAALVEETPTFDRVENRVSASLTIHALGSSSIITALYEETIDDTGGLIATPIWSGRPHEYHLVNGPERRTLIRTYSVTHLQDTDFSPFPPPADYHLTRRTRRSTPREIGMAGYTLRLQDTTLVEEYLFARGYQGRGAASAPGTRLTMTGQR